MKWLGQREEGFTLIELLVAIPIGALVVAAATAGIIQLLDSRAIDAGVLAQRQVQTVGSWVTRDGVQAQEVIINTGDGFPLVLKWSRYDNNETHEISYSLVPSSSGDQMNLQRTETVNGGDPVATVVGRYIDGDNTSCWWAVVQTGEPEEFTIRVTAEVGQRTESREYRVNPRVM